jgi:hypothetical protein
MLFFPWVLVVVVTVVTAAVAPSFSRRDRFVRINVVAMTLTQGLICAYQHRDHRSATGTGAGASAAGGIVVIIGIIIVIVVVKWSSSASLSLS